MTRPASASSEGPAAYSASENHPESRKAALHSPARLERGERPKVSNREMRYLGRMEIDALLDASTPLIRPVMATGSSPALTSVSIRGTRFQPSRARRDARCKVLEMPTVVCLGDSLTAWIGTPWPSLIPAPTLVAAREGATVDDLEAQLIDAHGDVAIVTVGTNDVLRLDRPLPDRLPDLNFARVAFIDTMLFLPFHPRRYRHVLADRRREMRKTLHASGHDVLSPPLPPWCWHRDGIHPNARGHRKIGAAVWDWLESNML